MNLKKIKQKRNCRPLIEAAICISRTQNINRDDLLASFHLLETQLLKFKTGKQPDVVALENISKRLIVLSTQLGH
jgi:hypothetical protein